MVFSVEVEMEVKHFVIALSMNCKPWKGLVRDEMKVVVVMVVVG